MKIWRERLRRYCWLIFRVALLSYCGLTLFLYVIQTKMIFPGAGMLDRDPASMGWAFEEILKPVAGGETHGWYIPAEEARGVVLYSHGNAENVGDALYCVELFRELGFSALVYDYGGYGKSTGKPSEQRAYEDVRAMWRFLVEEKKVVPKRIVIWGRSVGGGPASQLASEVEPGAIVLESTFSSAVNLAHETFPYLPVRLLMKHRFENIKKVSSFKAPLTIIHSKGDTLIPQHHGKALFDAAHDPKRFVETRGGHNDTFFVSWDLYKKVLNEFLVPLFPVL